MRRYKPPGMVSGIQIESSLPYPRLEWYLVKNLKFLYDTKLDGSVALDHEDPVFNGSPHRQEL